MFYAISNREKNEWTTTKAKLKKLSRLIFLPAPRHRRMIPMAAPQPANSIVSNKSWVRKEKE